MIDVKILLDVHFFIILEYNPFLPLSLQIRMSVPQEMEVVNTSAETLSVPTTAHVSKVLLCHIVIFCYC